MGRDRRKDIPMWAVLGHGKPVTRREMLATGLIPFSAWAIGPTITSLLARPAFAQDANCPTGSSSAYIPLITLNLSGGPSLAGQLAVKNLSGGYLSSYTKIGLGSGPGRSFNVEKEFGDVDFAGTAIGGNGAGVIVSKFLTGLRSPRAVAGQMNQALSKAAFVWSAVTLNDDTAANPIDITGLALKMGLAGEKLPNLGRSDSPTGIGQMPAVLPPPAPFVVRNVNDLKNALGYSSALTGLNADQKGALAKTISKLSGSQVRKIAETTGNEVTTKLVECAGLRNVDLIKSGGGDIDPLGVGGTISTTLAGIWGVQANDRTSQNAIFGSMVYNGLVGNASTVSLNMGGYDYHNNTRTTGDQKDLEAGQVVGKILETANAFNKPVFIYVCADGATSSGESLTADSPWMSDRGIAGMQYMIAFHPTGRPAVSGNQIGGFSEGQAADGKFPTSTSGELAAQAVFANYAAWNGRVDFLEQYRILGDANLRSQVIKMQKA